MTARFNGWEPVALQPVSPAPEAPWGVEFLAGDPLPPRPRLSAGTCTMRGADQGSTQVVITEKTGKTMITSIAVAYTDYSDGDGMVINGAESVHCAGESGFDRITWHSDLAISGTYTGTKRTSAGFTIGSETIRNNFQPEGTLTTTIDGHTYTQSANGT